MKSWRSPSTDHVQMVPALDVAPLKRERPDPPGPQPWGVQQLTEPGRTHARFEFKPVERFVRSLGYRRRQAGATLLAVEPDLALLVVQRLRAQNCRLQSISPRAIASRSFSSALL